MAANPTERSGDGRGVEIAVKEKEGKGSCGMILRNPRMNVDEARSPRKRGQGSVLGRGFRHKTGTAAGKK